MLLTKLPKIRISRKKWGYYVEVQQTTWYGKEYWTNLLKNEYHGNIDQFYSTKESAMKDVLLYIEKHIDFGTIRYCENQINIE